MKTYEPTIAARKAEPFHFGRPAMAVIHDAPDVRLMVLRIAAGQAVPLHASRSSVLLYVLSGCGLVSGQDGDHAVHPGMLVAYEPGETHGMRAISEELVLLATIAPRPSIREASAAVNARAESLIAQG
jgi:quercetin dioxygenase-like cupin family protein